MKLVPHSKPSISKEDKKAVANCIESGMLAEGGLKKRFEEKVATYLGYKSGIAMPSGSAALKLIFKSIGINKSDEVIIPTYVCHSVYDAIVDCGAKPVLCDVSENWVMAPENVKPIITKKTRAIILVHIFGIDVGDIGFVNRNIIVIHDYCQAFGLRSKIQGPAFCSFNATKCLTTGEGGMALFNNEKQIENAKRFLKEAGSLYIFSDLQASLGISQLQRYKIFLEKRSQIAKKYLKLLSNESLLCTKNISSRSIFYRFTIKSQKNVDEIIKRADEKYKLHIRKGVDELLHRRYNIKSDQYFPNAVKLFKQTLSLPIYPSLKKSEQMRVINFINKAIP